MRIAPAIPIAIVGVCCLFGLSVVALNGRLSVAVAAEAKGTLAAKAESTVAAEAESTSDEPLDSELLEVYSQDRANQARQTWRDYRDWVRTFYRGNVFSDGWIKLTAATLECVKAVDNQKAVRKRLVALGKTLSKEWAKDSKVRKINTADLRRWFEKFDQARRREDGSGRTITELVEDIKKQVESRS